MNLVLDVSAAVALARGGTESEIMDERLSGFREVISPDLFVAESANAIWKIHRLGGLERKEAWGLLERTLALPDIFTPCLELHREALELAWKSGVPVYDMFYLTLAKRRNAVLATLDGKLRKISVAEGIPVFPD